MKRSASKSNRLSRMADLWNTLRPDQYLKHPDVVEFQREKLLADLDASIPPHEVNKHLRVLLHGVGNHVVLHGVGNDSSQSSSIANPESSKKRKVNPSTTATRQMLPTFSLPPPWKAGDEDPKEFHWIKDIRLEPYHEKYLACFKIAEMGESWKDDKRRYELDREHAADGYWSVLVYGNVNLKNPGELAWMFSDTEWDELYRVIFHTEEEAELFREQHDQKRIKQLGIDEDDFESTSRVEEVQVEYSIDELDMEHKRLHAQKMRGH